MATLYGHPNNFRTQKVLAAAKYGNASLSVSDAPAPGDRFPFPVSPAYTNGKKALFGADAIAWEVCGNSLKGQNPDHQSEVLQWLQVAESEFLPAALGWVLPSISVIQHEKRAVETSRTELLHLLSILDKFLISRTFLVGERLSLADISLAFDLSPAYAYVLDPSVRKSYVNVNRWYNTIMHQVEVTQVAGTPQLCEYPAQFDAQKFKEYQAAKGGGHGGHDHAKKNKKGKGHHGHGGHHGGGHGQEKPTEEAEKKGSEEPKEEERDPTEEAMAEEPKKKDPFEQFPKGNWNMDEFKRVYSNEDTEKAALPYFWDHFEPDNYSIWYCEYKFPKELTLVFMSCNLIGGMFQRLDKMRKNAFGSMCLFGENNDSTIAGLWFWRGQELAFTLSPDWQIDFESYTWTKLDPRDEKTKKTVKEYFTWEFPDAPKPFNQGKIFK